MPTEPRHKLKFLYHSLFKERITSILRRLDEDLAPELFFVAPNIGQTWGAGTSMWVPAAPAGIVEATVEELVARHGFENKFSREGAFNPFSESLRDAIDRLAEAAGKRAIVSFPAALEQTRVLAVVLVSRAALANNPSLALTRVSDFNRFYPSAPSLLHGVLQDLFDEVAAAIRDDSDKWLAVTARTPEEVITLAGRGVMRNVRERCGSQRTARSSLFELFNKLSSLRHERREAFGSLVLTRNAASLGEGGVRFGRAVEVENTRALRKLVEMTGQTLTLVSDGNAVYGICRMDPERLQQDEALFEVRIVGHFAWELAHRGRVVMHVHEGMPSLPHKPFRRDAFVGLLRSVMGECDAETLARFAEAAAAAHHGTTLIVAADAMEEAQRLHNSSTVVESFALGERRDFWNGITSIDGAVLCDPAGRCHALGVILDGVQNEGVGDPSRGARYNSALRYVASRADRSSIAVTVSEDGPVDIVYREGGTLRHSRA